MSKDTLQTNERKSNNLLACSECRLTFQYEKIFKMHNSRIHKAIDSKYKTVVCSLCDNQFSSYRSLKFHLTQEHGNFSKFTKRYDRRLKACSICGVTVRHIEEHMYRQHTNPMKYPRIKCSMCDYEGKQPHLKSHFESKHTTNKIEACPFCAEIFKSVKGHLKRTSCGRDPSEAIPKVNCLQCSQVLAGKRGLRSHMKYIHNQVRDQQCQHCEYNTYSAGNLRLHMNKIHLGIPLVKVPCPHCDKKVGNLPLHMRTYHIEI